jgi:hypothetical protein
LGTKNLFGKAFGCPDFTLVKYEELCQAVADSNYTSVTLADYLKIQEPGNGKYIVMRHDIDRIPAWALGTAIIEQRHGIEATYYFRQQKGNTSRIMDRIRHETRNRLPLIETLDKSKGDRDAARSSLAKELAGFRTRYDVKPFVHMAIR